METDGSVEAAHTCRDSGMPVAPADPDDMHHDDAVGAFSAIVKGGLMATTSRLAAMEAVAAARKKARSHKCRSESAEETAGVEAHVRGMAGGTVRFVDSMENWISQGSSVWKAGRPASSSCTARQSGMQAMSCRSPRTTGSGTAGSDRATGCTFGLR